MRSHWSVGLPGCSQLHESAAIADVDGGFRCEVGTRGIQDSTTARGQSEISFKFLNKPTL